MGDILRICACCVVGEEIGRSIADGVFANVSGFHDVMWYD